MHVPYSLWGGGTQRANTPSGLWRRYTWPKAALLWHACTPSLTCRFPPCASNPRWQASCCRTSRACRTRSSSSPASFSATCAYCPQIHPTTCHHRQETLTGRGLQGADHHRHCCVASKNRGRLGSPLGQAIVRSSHPSVLCKRACLLGGGSTQARVVSLASAGENDQPGVGQRDGLLQVSRDPLRHHPHHATELVHVSLFAHSLASPSERPLIPFPLPRQEHHRHDTDR